MVSWSITARQLNDLRFQKILPTGKIKRVTPQMEFAMRDSERAIENFTRSLARSGPRRAVFGVVTGAILLGMRRQSAGATLVCDTGCATPAGVCCPCDQTDAISITIINNNSSSSNSSATVGAVPVTSVPSTVDQAKHNGQHCDCLGMSSGVCQTSQCSSGYCQFFGYLQRPGEDGFRCLPLRKEQSRKRKGGRRRK
jgi:hypothetical protein